MFETFQMSICNEGMRELCNPGASGSIFYLTFDDEFILKTVQHKEAEFLQKLLPGYFMNLNQVCKWLNNMNVQVTYLPCDLYYECFNNSALHF